MARGELAKKLADRDDKARSRLYLWMKANYDEIAAFTPPGSRRKWKAIRAEAVDAGVKVRVDEKDVDPSLAAIRSALLRLEADLGKIPKRTRKKDETKSEPIASPVISPTSDAGTPNPSSPRHQFGVAKLKREDK